MVNMARPHEAIDFVTDDLMKPDTDTRQYRALQLKNKMKVIVISDQDADKAAASMNINVG